MNSMGQLAAGDNARRALAQAMRDLEEAERALSAIMQAVGLRQEEHRITSEWMALMAREARAALANGTLDRLMTTEWLLKLERVGQRHDVASERLSAALETQTRAFGAHQTIAARVRKARAEASRAPAPPRPDPGRYPGTVPIPPVPFPRVPVPYYPWGVISPFSSITPWS